MLCKYCRPLTRTFLAVSPTPRTTKTLKHIEVGEEGFGVGQLRA